MEKPLLKCHDCNTEFYFPVERSWIMKNVLFFVPIKVYYCSHCNEITYLWLPDEAENKYQRV